MTPCALRDRREKLRNSNTIAPGGVKRGYRSDPGSRSLRALEDLANEAFQRRVGKLRREDGSVLTDDADLLTLTPDEELVVLP